MIHFIKGKSKYIIFILVIFSISFIGNDLNSKSTKKKNLTSKTIIKKSSPKKFKKKGKIQKQIVAPKQTKILIDTILNQGIIYKKILIPAGKFYNSVHIIEADLDEKNVKPVVLKAQNLVTELQILHDMINNYNSAKNEKVVGAVNANFWRAYTNHPIGPTVINGEVVEMKTHKKWSSGFFDKKGKLYINNFFLDGTVETKDGWVYNIKTVNRRRDTT